MIFFASAVDFSNIGEVWMFLIQIAIIFFALLVGNVLRTVIPALKKCLIPSSLIGGLLLLLLKFIPSFKLIIDNDLMQIITYHCLGFGFAATTLKLNKDKKKGFDIQVFEHSSIQAGSYYLQAFVGLAITIALYLITKSSNNPIFYGSGVILSLGFAQGPGNALSWDNKYSLAYPDLFSGNGSFGLSIACIGFIVASIIGVLFMNIKRARGKLVVRTSHQGDQRVVADYEGDNEIPATESVDKMSIQFALIIVVYGLAFALMYGLQAISDFTGSIGWGFNFLWASLFAMLVKLVYNKLRKHNIIKKEYINNYLLDRIGGLMFDTMIVAGVAAIEINDIKRYILPIVLLCSVGTIVTYLYIYFATKINFKGYENEAFLFHFGTLTGTVSNGMILLREVDSNYETPTAYYSIMHLGPTTLMVAPLLLLLNLVGSSLTGAIIAMGIFFILFVLCALFAFRRVIFKGKCKETIPFEG